jgi:hypothetical protein
LDIDIAALPTHTGVLGPGWDFYHVGIVTRRLEDGQESLGALLSLEWSSTKEGAEPGLATPDGLVDWTARLAHSRNGPLHVELLEGSPGSVWETDDLARLHHIAFWSDDVTKDALALVADGWRVEMTFFDAEGRPSNVAYMTRPGVPRVELVNAARRPAWLEFIRS